MRNQTFLKIWISSLLTRHTGFFLLPNIGNNLFVLFIFFVLISQRTQLLLVLPLAQSLSQKFLESFFGSSWGPIENIMAMDLLFRKMLTHYWGSSFRSVLNVQRIPIEIYHIKNIVNYVESDRTWFSNLGTWVLLRNNSEPTLQL